MFTFLITITYSLVRIVSHILLVGIRRNSVVIVIVMYVIVQQKIVNRGETTARQHIAIPIGRAKERRRSKLEPVRRLHYR